MWRIPVGAVLGFVAGAIVALALATAAIPIFGISQMEGAYAMGVVFTIMPAGGIAGAVLGAVIGGRRWRRRG